MVCPHCQIEMLHHDGENDELICPQCRYWYDLDEKVEMTHSTPPTENNCCPHCGLPLHEHHYDDENIYYHCPNSCCGYYCDLEHQEYWKFNRFGYKGSHCE